VLKLNNIFLLLNYNKFVKKLLKVPVGVVITSSLVKSTISLSKCIMSV
jgi:hypothetical protein